MDLVAFNLPICFYLTFAGMAFGLGLISLIVEQTEKKYLFQLALITVGLGLFSLIMDLENPWRFFMIISEFNSTSVIAWGARIVLFFVSLCFISLWYLESDRKIPAPVKGLLILFSLALGLYPGFVLAQAVARPFWDSSLLVVLFFLSGAHSAISLLHLLDESFRKKYFRSSKWDWSFIGFQTLFMFGYIFQTSSQDHFLTGDYAPVFWFFIVGGGWLLPIVTLLTKAPGESMLKMRFLGFIQCSFFIRFLILFIGQSSASFIGA